MVVVVMAMAMMACGEIFSMCLGGVIGEVDDSVL